MAKTQNAIMLKTVLIKTLNLYIKITNVMMKPHVPKRNFFKAKGKK